MWGVVARPGVGREGQASACLCRDAYLHLQRGAYRQAAIAYLKALRAARHAGLPEPSWGGLAAAYRALWQQTRNPRYLKRYLRYTCEQTDALQARVARLALRRLARAQPVSSQRT